VRRAFLIVTPSAVAVTLAAGYLWPSALWALVVIAPLAGLGVADMVQTRQAVRRNFPLVGHLRYLLEKIRPEINQYFVESNSDGRPFSRNDRSVVYQRAKGDVDTLPFGTQLDVYVPGYEWINRTRRRSSTCRR
jgi:glutamate synthase domain-containing protein 2